MQSILSLAHFSYVLETLEVGKECKLFLTHLSPSAFQVSSNTGSKICIWGDAEELRYAGVAPAKAVEAVEDCAPDQECIPT